MNIEVDTIDEWPYQSYTINEFGLVDNSQPMPQDILNAVGMKGMLNLARFFFFNANDGLVDDIEEAANEIMNIMRGEFYISNTDGEE